MLEPRLMFSKTGNLGFRPCGLEMVVETGSTLAFRDVYRSYGNMS